MEPSPNRYRFRLVTAAPSGVSRYVPVQTEGHVSPVTLHLPMYGMNFAGPFAW